MLNGIGNEFLYSAYRIKTRFTRRSTEKPLDKVGTAFFVKNGNDQICLVTNRHMLDAGYNTPPGAELGTELTQVLVEGFLADQGDISRVPLEHCYSQLILPFCEAKFPLAYAEDVACFVAPQAIFANGRTSIDFALRYADLATEEWLNSQMSIYDFVVFPGFPPWHDKLANRPILRSGTIASDPRTNYSPTPVDLGRRVAYEAFSFEGSSGSPVLAIQKGFQMPDILTVTGFREAKIIGINAGHFDHGVANMHSGISFFLRSSVILEVIDGAMAG